MDLTKIKLSGFKSFVDPTTIEFKSNLTGVVGPNGCGKSNIIDAVRWVMGEISAKQLRGESMTDCIFNGSNTRKPVGQASVEMYFDNSDATLGGEYAKYQEISIRREVDREGFSDYFLNNVRCRRKDITNIFLGTGLGTNSYAIIEQGMISQLIEAKPDELRVLIEEAAGISKYKERRRETENRIKHTRENLQRLNDIREELEKQLKHLKSQANAAERYKKLKQEERLTKAQLHVLHWQDLAQKLLGLENSIKTEEANVESKTSQLHVVDAQISQKKEEHNVEVDLFNKAQENFYRVGADIARLEQQIHHIKERQEQLTRDLEQVNQVWQETIAHQASDKGQIELLASEKTKLESDVISATEIAQKSQQEMAAAEEQMKLSQEEWECFNSNAAQILQRLEVEQTRIQHLEQRIGHANQTLEKLTSELYGIDFVALTAESNELNNRFHEVKTRQDSLHSAINHKQQLIVTERDTIAKIDDALNQTRTNLQNLRGRKASFEALQQAALGKNDEILGNWLKQNNLHERPRLAQELKVESGWETAVETVLGNFLEAVCVDGFDNISSQLKSLSHGNLVLFDTQSATQNPVTSSLLPLASKVNSKLPLLSLLQGVYAVENLSDALSQRNNLGASESLITKDGVWLGNSWLRVNLGDNQKAGIIRREQELQDLIVLIDQEQTKCTAEELDLEREQEKLLSLEQEHNELHQQLRQIAAEFSELQGRVSANQTKLNHLREREQVLTQEIKTHEVNVVALKEQLATAKQAWDEASTKKAADETKRQTLIQHRDELQQRLSTARERANSDQQNVANMAMRQQLLQSQVEYLAQSLERAEKRLVNLKEHQESVQKSLAEAVAPLAQIEAELQQELARRVTVESELTQAKQKVSATESTLRELDQIRLAAQESIEQIRSGLEKLRTEREGLQVRSNTYKEQIAELEYQLEDVVATLTPEANITEWEEKISHLTSRIERLGPINLAAIDEFAQLEERKKYLDEQNQDLVNALSTLENAIRKIDHETRDRFKDTFDLVNQKFQELFPKVFNGGKAYLEFTSNDLLETGIMILAQPPGKRNASIHLLSGGEKALTAISLIFSIFQLTPAPFCMLDEVDAPLDDVNVGRFCNLVKEMAKSIQFIFVTHNKLTMEIASQLIGVTMQEAGVSRIVSVDIDQAVALAGAN